MQRLKGWYRDPDDPSQRRYWDGRQWTDESADAVAVTPPPTTDVSRMLHRTVAASQHVAERAASVGKGVRDNLTDPAQITHALNIAAPALDAALDSAKLRNRNGKVKVWRVARAAVRPRRTLTKVTSGVTAATGHQISTALRNAGNEHLEPIPPSDTDIVAEWPTGDAITDLEQWREGSARFAAAGEHDHEELRASAQQMCALLKHCLFGAPILDDDDAIVDTVGDVLAGVLRVEDDDWEGSDEKAVRLALAVARRFGVQPVELGGNGELDGIFDDAHSRMLMAMSVAPSKWSCDLSIWFTDRLDQDAT